MKESAMSEMIAIPRHRPAGNERGRGHPRFIRALLGLTIGVLGFAVAASGFDLVRTVVAEQAATLEPVVNHPAPELPPEWRWQPKGVEYEHMYRKKTSPRFDWIRVSR
jgi:hypothetical protein